ncbi:hypothetical protein LSAT2_005680 [Lamellibrachia satsuma]|nr:hypothetical protein LSAT2_005680 [Lamellibrachia satsuma]
MRLIAGGALTGGGDFGPRRIRPNCHVVSACSSQSAVLEWITAPVCVVPFPPVFQLNSFLSDDMSKTLTPGPGPGPATGGPASCQLEHSSIQRHNDDSAPSDETSVDTAAVVTGVRAGTHQTSVTYLRNLASVWRARSPLVTANRQLGKRGLRPPNRSQDGRLKWGNLVEGELHSAHSTGDIRQQTPSHHSNRQRLLRCRRGANRGNQ